MANPSGGGQGVMEWWSDGMVGKGSTPNAQRPTLNVQVKQRAGSWELGISKIEDRRSCVIADC
jgi:hypothetical protein